MTEKYQKIDGKVYETRATIDVAKKLLALDDTIAQLNAQLAEAIAEKDLLNSLK